MGSEQVAAQTSDAVSLDFDRFRLRTFVGELGNIGELEHRRGTTKLTEIAAKLEANPKAVLFDDAGGHPLIGNVLAGRRRYAQAFGVTPQQLLPEILRRLRTFSSRAK